MMESSTKDERFKKNSDEFMEKEQNSIQKQNVDIDNSSRFSSDSSGEGKDGSCS